MIIFLPLLISLIGGGMWLLAADRWRYLGLVMFGCGLLAFLLAGPGAAISLLGQ